ncbi:MAG: DUF1573 domain-containing protein [Chitinophagaceae bacterium]
MNNYLILLVIVALYSCSEKSSEERQTSTKLSTSLVKNPNDIGDSSAFGCLTFVDTFHNFGTIKEGENVKFDFEYTNTGNKDIIISHAAGSCGCTVPVYDQNPIKPNQKGSIEVNFNSQGKKGYNSKTVGIRTNGKPSEYTLLIDVIVE